jgi:hypothetical protein
MRPFLYSFFVVLCLSLPLLARPIVTRTDGMPAKANVGAASMPKECRPGKTSPESLGWRWRPDTVVSVYYAKNNFSAAEIEALSQSVNNWNVALKEIDSHIVFVIAADGESGAGDGGSVTVMRGIPRGKERLGEMRLNSASNGVVRLTVTISPVVTDLNALKSLMTHELGHTLGLADCYDCRRGTTAMAAFKDNNKGNDVYEPSACDKYVVASGYARQTGAQARVALTEQK